MLEEEKNIWSINTSKKNNISCLETYSPKHNLFIGCISICIWLMFIFYFHLKWKESYMNEKNNSVLDSPLATQCCADHKAR